MLRNRWPEWSGMGGRNAPEWVAEIKRNIQSFRESLRIPEKDKVSRDLMIYFLWQTGRFTNQKISGLFGLSYASVSRRVAIFREKLRVDKTFKKEYDRISALIKM